MSIELQERSASGELKRSAVYVSGGGSGLKLLMQSVKFRKKVHIDPVAVMTNCSYNEAIVAVVR